MHLIRSAVLLALLPVVVAAQPLPATRWLMSEPMSLFDWGIYRLQTKLSSIANTSPQTPAYLHGFATYDGKTNRIRIAVALIGTGTESECIENLRRVKAVLVPYGMSDEERNKAAPAVFAEMFGHASGYGSREAPLTVGEELASIISLDVSINRKDAIFSLKPAMSCTGDFKSTSISVSAQ